MHWIKPSGPVNKALFKICSLVLDMVISIDIRRMRSRGSGETGRHAALRGLWEKSRGGSSPFFRTRI